MAKRSATKQIEVKIMLDEDQVAALVETLSKTLKAGKGTMTLMRAAIINPPGKKPPTC